MTSIINVIFLIIGLAIFAFGAYYFLKEKQDPESRKIYGITVLAGIIVTVFMIIRII
ncbi:MAG: hypothetical protein LUC97_11935 [Clostridiales bacterium]|nr:hypothetical protein [Clostridiales bacterium]